MKLLKQTYKKVQGKFWDLDNTIGIKLNLPLNFKNTVSKYNKIFSFLKEDSI
jgi:hypothetical protein